MLLPPPSTNIGIPRVRAQSTPASNASVSVMSAKYRAGPPMPSVVIGARGTFSFNDWSKSISALQTVHCRDSVSPVSSHDNLEGDTMKNMITLILFTLMITALVHAGSRPRSGDDKLNADDRAKDIKMLHDSQNELMGYIEKLSDAQWNARRVPF